MVDYKFIVCSIVAVLSFYLYYKITPNIPKPNEGIIFYYKCSGFNERKSLKEGSKDFENVFSESRFIFILIPGYTESSTRPWLQVLSEELLKAEPSSCVIFVEHWNYLTFSRPFMAENVKKIANDIANLLLASGMSSFMNVHAIGFSMGGWVAGCISNFLPKEKQIGRITGLDPSFPWKDTDNPDDFLDSGDADVVVILRTSRISVPVPLVEFDFCVNGCKIQPECDIWWHPSFIRQICSHYKTPFLFASHLTEKKEDFSSCRCPSRTTLLEGNCSCLVKNTFGLNMTLR
ncbi:Phospholipase A1 member A [Armadillidium nasatum]|uniref:Phospholipase A1 member A n=1 Tax=Armadillidium nasatum TaxID=96803 RepID=A0A5N5TFQ9_9CRUS|nr:Phospholipase A1 member A [Armadillidium nasatum]